MTKVLGGVASDDYKIARDKFWELALETDEFKQSDFESEFNKLVAFVECAETESNTDAIEGALAWLRQIYERREKWAYRYTWSYFTAGANSSQRAEAVHSALKVGVDQTHLLVDLIKYVEKYEEIKEIRNEL
mmetsp:Transcript_17612/g.43808  ORF Transcript_17612/g.43808 Transcript_17612/m.43808 type:complete len:132 (-) Transcript_17612:351-746(-)